MSGPTAVDEARPMPQHAVRVVVVDDDADVRLLVRRLLGSAGMELAGEACDGAEAVDVVRRTQPDVVLLDLNMPKVAGDEALPHLVQVAPSTMVVVFTAAEVADAGRERLLNLGAFAYHDKADVHRLSELLAEDLALFRRVLAGEDAVPGWLTDSHG